MTKSTLLTFRHVTDMEDVRQLLCDIHAEVRGEFGLLERPFYSVERFNERLTSHSSAPGWEAIIGYTEGVAVGFAYGYPLGPKTRWWEAMREPLPEGYTVETGTRTFALNEGVLRKPWRGTDVSRRAHDELLSGRSEERATLLVNPQFGDGKLKAVYESWGYEQIGTQQPFPDSPMFAVMMRTLITA